MHHRQGDYTDIGNKASHPSQQMNNNNTSNKKMLDTIPDQHSSRYDDISKKMGNTPKLCQNGMSSNVNGISSNSKRENHSYNNNNRVSQGNIIVEFNTFHFIFIFIIYLQRQIC